MYGLDLPCFEGSAYSVAAAENLMGPVVVADLGVSSKSIRLVNDDHCDCGQLRCEFIHQDKD